MIFSTGKRTFGYTSRFARKSVFRSKQVGQRLKKSALVLQSVPWKTAVPFPPNISQQRLGFQGRPLKPLLSVEIFEKVPPKVCVFQKVESRKRKAKLNKETLKQEVEAHK